MNDVKIPPDVEKAVSWAYGLLVIGSLLALLQVPFDPRLAKIPSAFAVAFVMVLLAGGATWFLISKVKNQRNWARITLLVLLCISIPGMLKSIGEAFKFVPFFGFTSILLWLGEIYCLSLLFCGPANRWFSERPEEPTTTSGSFLEEEARFRTRGIHEKEQWRNR